MKDTFTPTTSAAVEAFAKIKNGLAANLEGMTKANEWKERLGYPAISVSKHYAIVHHDISQPIADRRLDALENNFKTVYLWFAIRGKALPVPTEKLTAVIVGDASEFRRYRETFEASNLPPTVSMPAARTLRSSAAAGWIRPASTSINSPRTSTG